MTTWKNDQFIAQGGPEYTESKAISSQRSAQIADYVFQKLTCFKCGETTSDFEVHRPLGGIYHLDCPT